MRMPVLMVGKNGLGVVAIAGLLIGCVSSYGGLTRETMAACINEAGITGTYSASSTLRNDRMTFIVRPGLNVTEAQADIANQCIARTIDGGGTTGSATVSSSAIAPSSSRPVSDIGSQCSKGGGPMQGGAGYC